MTPTVTPADASTLYITSITLRWHTRKDAFDLAANIENVGEALVNVPFTISLAVEYISDYLQSPPLSATGEETFQVQASIPDGGFYTSDYFLNIPFLLGPGMSSAVYTFYARVGDNLYRLSEPLVRPPFRLPGGGNRTGGGGRTNAPPQF